MHLVHSVINILHQTTIDIVDIYAQCPNCLLHSVAILAYNIWGGGHGPMASTVAQAYNGGLGAVPPAGFRGRAPGQEVRGAKPPRS